jgi:hypothetical protein
VQESAALAPPSRDRAAAARRELKERGEVRLMAERFRCLNDNDRIGRRRDPRITRSTNRSDKGCRASKTAVDFLSGEHEKRNLADAIVSADNILLRNLTAEDLQLLLSYYRSRSMAAVLNRSTRTRA